MIKNPKIIGQNRVIALGDVPQPYNLLAEKGTNETTVTNQRGISLVEVLVASIIVVLAALGIYIGILYAESQLNRNYHDRVATLHASGECDWQYYNIAYRNTFDEFSSKQVVIDYFEQRDGTTPLTGTMTMEIDEQVDVVFGRTMRYNTLLVKVVWEEPMGGERIIAVREDIFR